MFKEFKITTTDSVYKKYNGLICRVCREPPRTDEYLECYVPSKGELILLRTDELEELDYD